MNDAIFSQLDFGPINEFLMDDNVTDISYSNNGQVFLKTLTKGVYKVERPEINNALMEKLAFQCSNVMGKTFNMAHPFLDAESTELRLNFVHESIATNGIAVLIRKTPAKIRLNKDKLIKEDYVTEDLLNFLIDCVHARCNIIVSGETGSGKTELVKYLASNTREDEKIISIEDTLELHLDRIYPNRDIVAMKTNNIASYTDVLVTCMRQNPIWILLAEVRSAEAVLAIRNSISSGHHIMSTIHADKAASIPMRMYSLLESSQDTEQFLSSIHRYVQLGIYVKGYMSKKYNRFQREILEVCEFYVDDDNKPCTNTIYHKSLDGTMSFNNPTQHLKDYCSIQGVVLGDDPFHLETEKTTTSNLKNPLEEPMSTISKENENLVVDKTLNKNNFQQVEANTSEKAVENLNVINSQVPPIVNNTQTSANNISNITNIDMLDVL
jgi:pilus assembly protein CpaF